MKFFKTVSLMAIIMLSCHQKANSQDSTGIYNKVLYFPDKLFKKINDKAADIHSRLINQTEKYLRRLAKEERKLKKKLAARDSSAATEVFGDAAKQYANLQNKMNNVSGKSARLRNKYLPHVDTLHTALHFLAKTDGLLKYNVGTNANVVEAINKMDVLQQKFSQAEEIQKHLNQRRLFLQEQLSKYGLLKDVKKLQKQVYYYQAQVEEYKRILQDPSKMEAKAIDLLKQTTLFRDFFKKHSQLAGLFNMPGVPSANPTVALAGLQTRDAIRQQLLERFGSGPNIQQMMQQQVQGAQAQLNQLKDKISQMGGGSSDIEMPDFKPNNQKTKRFKDRLELGSNLQTAKSNRFFPSTSDIGVSLGYKLNNNSILGVGSSYKMGWGNDIRHIRITHQGVGLRSFVDYKIKGSFWLSGGAEMNYRSQFRDFEILKDYTAWQKTVLLGLSKKYTVSKKLGGNIQLMYDFLWKEQVPKTQPVLFRVGYTLRN